MHIVTLSGLKWQYKVRTVRLLPQNDCQVLQDDKFRLELPSGHGLRHLRRQTIALVSGHLFGTVVPRSKGRFVRGRNTVVWRLLKQRNHFPSSWQTSALSLCEMKLRELLFVS